MLSAQTAVWGPYRGVVARVVDGDTVDVQLDLGFDLTVHARVRLAGVNAPELGTFAGRASAAYMRELLPEGASVDVRSVGWDKYGGRVDGRIEAVHGDVAELLVRAGHAVPWDGKGKRP